jgi:hypothetical protein
MWITATITSSLRCFTRMVSTNVEGLMLKPSTKSGTGQTRKSSRRAQRVRFTPSSRQQRGRHPSANHSEIKTFCYLVAPITIWPKGQRWSCRRFLLCQREHLRDPVAKWVTLQALLVCGDDVFGEPRHSNSYASGFSSFRPSGVSPNLASNSVGAWLTSDTGACRDQWPVLANT